MSDNKDNDFEQDFIDQGDEFAESIDDNFASSDIDPMADDHILEMDDLGEPTEGLDDNSWEEDFDGIDDDLMMEDEVSSGGQVRQRNWFNIAIFGVTGLVVLVMAYNFVWPYFASPENNTQQVASGGVAVQNTNLAQVATPQQNALLAEQALMQNDNSQSTSSILADPSLLGDGVESIERPDPEADENALFGALGNVPQMPEDEINDIFAAIDQVNMGVDNSQNNQPQEDTLPQILPEPADEIVLDNVFDNLVEVSDQQPRAPQDDDTGIESLMNMVETEILTQPEQQAVQEAPAEIQQNAPQVQNSTTVDLSEVNDRIDAVMNRLDSLAQKIDSMESAAVGASLQPVQSNSADNSKIEQLERTIKTLESKITNMAAQETKPAPKKVATRTARAPTPQRTTPARQTKEWDLRGASTGEAFVAERGTQNLRTVTVGDTLSGIGRITSIAVENGRWVVRGTSGRITQ
jgi:hypothetical protein